MLNGTRYAVGTQDGAGLGNLYEETVYAVARNGRCYGIRLFLHYSVLENYPPGAVFAYDRTKVLTDFHAMISSLAFK